MICWSRVTNIGTDSDQIPSGQIEYMEKARDIVYVFPYGYSAQPILDGLAIKASVGSDENAVAFPMSWKHREKGLKQGEVAIKNGLTETVIKFQEDGSLKINSKNEIIIDAVGNITINCPSVESTTNWDNTGTFENTGNVTINGNLQVNGTISGLTTITATGALAGASITAGGMSATGGAVSATSMSATGDVTAGSISLKTHLTGGVTPGGGVSGLPQ